LGKPTFRRFVSVRAQALTNGFGGTPHWLESRGGDHWWFTKEVCLFDKEDCELSKIIVINHLTLDGVMQAPGRPDEDTRGGFEYGGWAQAGNDAVMGQALGEGMASGGALLFGRRTYEDFAAFWPKQAEPNPFTVVLNTVQKYVVSRTLEEPLAWSNSTLLKGDAAVAVASLKERSGQDISIMGSGELIQSLMLHNLIDEYLLMIHPLILGTGRRLFPDGASFAKLRLVKSLPTTTGVIIATYQPAGATAL
jgi:dihydrofolate reductase